MSAADLVIPLMLAAVMCACHHKGADAFLLLRDGARDGIKTALELLPTLVAVMLAVSVFKASGAVEAFSDLFSPLLNAVGIPRETAPLMLIRPLSGSGALAVFDDILHDCGADSRAGRVASVMQGSTETTFYVSAVYYAVTRVRNTRHTLASAAVGDLAGFIMSAVTVSLFFG